MSSDTSVEGAFNLRQRLARRVLLAGAMALAGSALLSGTANAQLDGKALFAQNCSACHQAAGQGIPGAFPALAGDKLVQGPGEAVAGVVLNGRGGMPAFAGDLPNDTIAAILTYVRGAWGNSAAPITPATVAGVRAGTGVEHAGSALQAH